MKGSYIVEFDCGEAVLLEGVTRAESEAYHDDLGCTPETVYGPEQAHRIEINDLWTKGGQMRVKYRVLPDGGAP